MIDFEHKKILSNDMKRSIMPTLSLGTASQLWLVGIIQFNKFNQLWIHSLPGNINEHNESDETMGIIRTTEHNRCITGQFSPWYIKIKVDFGDLL